MSETAQQIVWRLEQECIALRERAERAEQDHREAEERSFRRIGRLGVVEAQRNELAAALHDAERLVAEAGRRDFIEQDTDHE